ncbi:MAG TPA: class I SAM-dependent methyltransferase [Bryobacteraceae bacterium]|nr:class I SAM-dependent methyltransferase [Bryobacteraceae bacterium]
MQATARQQFLNDYAKIRMAEGRGSDDPAYYRALPYRDLTGKNSEQWLIRARSYRYFETKILGKRPLDILDLGAGNCWMSYRLALRQHRPVALDIFADGADGLAAARHYPTPFHRVEAEYDRLPFESGRFDLVIYNSSIHYSSDYGRTLAEARRVLRPQGRAVIMDSPIYREREHGELMRSERHAYFEQTYGFRSDHLESIEYFDYLMLQQLSRDLRIRWEVHRPWLGLAWHLRPWKARLRGTRPPSRFWILVARFQPRLQQ